jgi:hypothetical protein
MLIAKLWSGPKLHNFINGNKCFENNNRKSVFKFFLYNNRKKIELLLTIDNKLERFKVKYVRKKMSMNQSFTKFSNHMHLTHNNQNVKY